jgi:hypothetical protein
MQNWLESGNSIAHFINKMLFFLVGSVNAELLLFLNNIFFESGIHLAGF